MLLLHLDFPSAVVPLLLLFFSLLINIGSEKLDVIGILFIGKKENIKMNNE